jgi:hypothetical protein
LKRIEQQAAEDIAALVAEKERLEHENMLLKVRLEGLKAHNEALANGVLRLALARERTGE